MATTAEHPLAKAYLERLDQSLSQMEPSQATVLRAQIIAHINLSLTSETEEPEVSAVLDELGPPEKIVAEALREQGVKPRESLFGVATKVLLQILLVLVLVASLALLASPLFGASVPLLTVVLALVIFVTSLVMLRRLRMRVTRL